MISRGSNDERTAHRHLALWQAMVPHWNQEADLYRRAARGQVSASPGLLDDADRCRAAIREALSLSDTLCDNLAPGHELLGDLFRLAATLEALSASIATSVEQIMPRIEADRDIAGLRYLVSALRTQPAAAKLPMA